jgi:glycosyltransferase involved in cell wall biosynthesis
VHLVCLCDELLPWPLGKVWTIKKTPQAIYDLLREQSFDDSEAWLFWDSELGQPDPDKVLAALRSPGDVWHGGLRLGMSGCPHMMDFVRPAWLLNLDPDPAVEATSWRLSLRACLIRAGVLRQMGSVNPNFETLDAASLEMGYRYVTSGVLVRYFPSLLDERRVRQTVSISFVDECRFILYRFGRKWLYWSLFRALLTGYAKIQDAGAGLRPAGVMSNQVYGRVSDPPLPPAARRVSVLIPTMNRYEYLRKLLVQLAQQTIRPLEIIVVDQTSESDRVLTLCEENPGLPLKILILDHPGQCSARNEGLRIAEGDYILFLDDDVEIPSDLIEAHLRTLLDFQASVSSGIALSESELKKSNGIPHIRCSDNLLTGNTLIRRSVLLATGLFDTAYERGNAEDLDLGMRTYLSGALMLINSAIKVIHHRAPTGGLRTPGSQTAMPRNLPTVTDIYFWKRYFTPTQVRERLWIVLFRTLSSRGNALSKILNFLGAISVLPASLWRIARNQGSANAMLEEFPQIPLLGPQLTGTPLVSVLMPVYNREKLVGDAIRSIQNQTFSNWELIILDDASSDGTLEVCREFASADNRIRVLQNERNLGVGECRNHLIRQATGKYIAMQDSDDVSVPERLAWEVEILETKPQIGVVSGVVEWRDFDDGRVLWHFPPWLHAGKQYPQNKARLVKLLYLSCDLPNAACMFRRSLIDHLGEPYGKYRVNEDWYFMIKLAHRTLGWGTPKILVHMNRGRRHSHVLSSYIWSLREAQRMKHHLYESYRNRSDSPINYRLFLKSVARLVHWEGMYLSGWKGRLKTVRALSLDPFYADAWKWLGSSCKRALKKRWRLTGKASKKTAVLSQSGD